MKRYHQGLGLSSLFSQSGHDGWVELYHGHGPGPPSSSARPDGAMVKCRAGRQPYTRTFRGLAWQLPAKPFNKPYKTGSTEGRSPVRGELACPELVEGPVLSLSKGLS